MCIIIAIPRGNDATTKTELRNAWTNNPDGAGFAYAHNGKIETRHFMRFATFSSAFWPAIRAYGAQSSFLVHFRIATQGSVCLGNCHPFVVNDGLVAAHNGILPIKAEKGDDRSDTKIFIDRFLARLWPGWERDTLCRAVVEAYLGTSMLATLDAQGKITVFNQHRGEPLEDGRWASNATMSESRWTAYMSGYGYDDDLDWGSYIRSHTAIAASANNDDDARTYHQCPICEQWCDSQFWDRDVDACNVCIMEIDASIPRRSIHAMSDRELVGLES